MDKNKRVLVAMSGGVDSSVSAALLKKQGFTVIGAMMRFWPDEKRTETFDTCCSPDAAFEARRVADQVGVPFYLLDYREEFERSIRQPFLSEYAAGRTPNPCVNCNTKVKFDALVKKARMLGCEYVATGHYVKRVDREDGTVEFHRGLDPRKDQTYFLWGTARAIMKHLIFPVGEMEKPQVRELASAYGLITAKKPESQNICFVPGALKDYLAEYIPQVHGPMVDIRSGEVVGEHLGTQFYTLGQKKGLGLFDSSKVKYVIHLEPERQIVWVGEYEDCHWSGLEVNGANYLLEPKDLPQVLEVQVRYGSPAVPARVLEATEEGFRLEFESPQFAVAPGQSAVLYSGSRLLGGGVVVNHAPTLPEVKYPKKKRLPRAEMASV